MLLLKSIRKHQDRSMVHLAVPTSIHFHFAKGFLHPNTRIDVRLLGPCFKTGHLRPLCQHPHRSAVLSHSRQHCTTGYNTPRKELHSHGLFPTTITDADPQDNRVHPQRMRIDQLQVRLVASASLSTISRTI